MAIIYTNNSSGAIRKARNKKPTKAYLKALSEHIKYLKSMGFDCDDNGKIKLTRDSRHSINIAERTFTTRENTMSDVPMSNNVGCGGTKPDNSWKIEASKNFTIVPAYNKGPYMVVNKSDLKTAGRKV